MALHVGDTATPGSSWAFNTHLKWDWSEGVIGTLCATGWRRSGRRVWPAAVGLLTRWTPGLVVTSYMVLSSSWARHEYAFSLPQLTFVTQFFHKQGFWRDPNPTTQKCNFKIWNYTKTTKSLTYLNACWPDVFLDWLSDGGDDGAERRLLLPTTQEEGGGHQRNQGEYGLNSWRYSCCCSCTFTFQMRDNCCLALSATYQCISPHNLARKDPPRYYLYKQINSSRNQIGVHKYFNPTPADIRDFRRNEHNKTRTDIVSTINVQTILVTNFLHMLMSEQHSDGGCILISKLKRTPFCRAQNVVHFYIKHCISLSGQTGVPYPDMQNVKKFTPKRVNFNSRQIVTKHRKLWTSLNYIYVY